MLILSLILSLILILIAEDQQLQAELLARNAGFIKAEAHLLHLSGQPTTALRKLMDLDPKTAFDYLEDGIQSSQTSKNARDQLCQAAVDLRQEFLQADADNYAILTLRSFPARFSEIMKSLSSASLKFRYATGLKLFPPCKNP